MKHVEATAQASTPPMERPRTHSGGPCQGSAGSDRVALVGWKVVRLTPEPPIPNIVPYVQTEGLPKRSRMKS